jgi:CelD/BcsL family acetyltransferase involved in cellulose biosynthesis
MSQAVTSHDGRMRVQLITSAAEFAPLKDAWLALEAQSGDPCVFQSYAWCGHVAETLTRWLGQRYQPLVAVGWHNGQAAAILPLSRQKRSGVWQLCTLDDPFGQFAGLLAQDDASALAVVGEVLRLVRQQRGADLLRLDRVVAGSRLETALRANGASVRGEIGAPVLDLRPWPDFEALKGSRNKKTMKNLRNATNRLGKAGVNENRFSTDPAGVESIIEATLQRRTAWLNAHGLTSPQFRSPAHQDIIMGGHAWGLERFRVGFELDLDGLPIALQWGFAHNKHYYAYMSATDPASQHLNSGRLHLANVIRQAQREGFEAIEMLTPASDYKMVWTDTIRTVRDYAVPLSRRGSLHDLLWQRTLRPIAKACFYALPKGLRQRASRADGSAAGQD